MAQRATVGARELKIRLGAWLQQVRQGRTLIITDRGQPVAELKPLQGPTDEETRLERLKALGAVTRAERRTLAPFRAIRSRDRQLASDAIVADRDDRL
jgi:prevent-host-death family protein